MFVTEYRRVQSSSLALAREALNSSAQMSTCCYTCPVRRIALASLGERELRTQFVDHTWYPETVHRITDLAIVARPVVVISSSAGRCLLSLIKRDYPENTSSGGRVMLCLAEYSTPPSSPTLFVIREKVVEG